MDYTVRKIVAVVACAFVCGLSPLSSTTVLACEGMSGASAKAMDGDTASCCSTGDCHCGVSAPSGAVELAMLPSTLVSSGPISSAAFTAVSTELPQVPSRVEPANVGSPPESSGKEKIYDLESTYRI